MPSSALSGLVDRTKARLRPRPAPAARRPGRLSLARLPLRARVIIVVGLVYFGVMVIGAWLLVANARDAVREETAASVELAKKLSIAVVASSLRQGDPAEALIDLRLSLQQPRHVRITLVNNEGDILSAPASAEAEEAASGEAAPPEWFRKLIAPPVEIVTIPIALEGRSYGTVVITTAPSDEIAEVWHDFGDLFVLMLSAFVVLLFLVHLLLGRTLRPIATILRGLEDLREARYGVRLPRIPEPDLDLVGSRLNALAAKLEATTREKDQLGQQLVDLQDSERKAIALELHDEFGPCLFGIQVSARDIEATCQRMSGSDADALAERARAIIGITDQMQAQSRAILRRLRPMTLGQVSLSDLLEDLVEGFRSRHPGITWRTAVPDEPASFGDTVDLTLYRAVQEALTNAARHAQPKTVEIALTVHHTPAEGCNCRVELRVQDDGLGPPEGLTFGLGLTGMSHRARILGGRFEIGGGPQGGTAIRLSLPAKRAEVGAFVQDTATS